MKKYPRPHGSIAFGVIGKRATEPYWVCPHYLDRPTDRFLGAGMSLQSLQQLTGANYLCAHDVPGMYSVTLTILCLAFITGRPSLSL